MHVAHLITRTSLIRWSKMENVKNIFYLNTYKGSYFEKFSVKER